MRSSRPRLFVLLALTSLAGFTLGCTTTETPSASVLPAGEERAAFPTPDFLSERARDVLSRPIDRSRSDAPVPQTAEEWHARREATEEAFMAPYVAKALAASGVQVEKTELAGVTVRVLTPRLPATPSPASS